MDHHCKIKPEFTDLLANGRIDWTSVRMWNTYLPAALRVCVVYYYEFMQVCIILYFLISRSITEQTTKLTLR